MADDWTPYALESYRGRALWRRRIFAVLAFLLLAGGWLVFTAMNTTKTTTTGFADGTSGAIDLTQNDRKPLTLTLQVGRLNTAPGVVDAPSTGTDTSAPEQRDNTGPYFAQTPINIRFYLTYLIPLVMVLGLALILGRRRVHGMEEVNFGIYKGSMPLEMISASYKHLVVTNRRAALPLFGKGRLDYVPRHVAEATDAAERDAMV